MSRRPRVGTRLRWVAVGAVATVGAERLVARRLPHHRINAAAAGLVIAAGVYPVTRSDSGQSAARAGALAIVAAAMIAVALPPDAARRVLALGWLSHAAVDAVVHLPEDGIVPEWYRPLCVGADVAVAGLLAAVD